MVGKPKKKGNDPMRFNGKTSFDNSLRSPGSAGAAHVLRFDTKNLYANLLIKECDRSNGRNMPVLRSAH